MATSGPDTLIGTDGADTTFGLGGNDVIYGMSGASTSPIAGRISAVRVGTGLGDALFANSAPGDPDHLYVVTKSGGVISRLDPSDGSSVPFLNIPADQFSTDGERGVLSLAFHPDYAEVGDPDHGRFFVYLTNASGDIEVREYDADDGVDGAPVKTIITIPHPGENNHNGGTIAFGPNDGYLYISTGDGGGGNDQHHNAQDLTKLLGKILRIDVDGTPDLDKNYATPSDNPFDGATAGADEIWAYGLRNPFRISFDSNGDLYIGDVGQGAREEIDFQAAGAAGGRNYGWPAAEGTLGTPPAGAIPPIFDYSHTLGNVVTGGVVYRGSGPSLVGSYFFIDFGSDRFWTLKVVDGVATAVADRTEQLFSPSGPVSSIASFGQDGQGNIYMVSLGGDIFRLDMSAFAGDLGDDLHGGAGNDRIYGGPGADSLHGDANDDLLSGGYGDDLLLGGPGSDTLDGGPGVDTLRGGPGNDIYVVTSTADHVQEAAGNGRDRALSEVSTVLPANIEVLRLLGTNLIDGTGNAAANTLIGNLRANHLSGAGGNDLLYGQRGADVLSGGGGQDGFIFNTVLAATNIDRIVDFAPADDTIYLANAVFHGLALGHLAPGAFFVGAAAHDANDRVIYNPSTGWIIFDPNGNSPGGGTHFATVVNHAALGIGDFLVI